MLWMFGQGQYHAGRRLRPDVFQPLVESVEWEAPEMHQIPAAAVAAAAAEDTSGS
jgi:hypothetical protein